MLALWVIVIALAGKLGGVQRDRPVDYLPASADSTQVAKITEQMPGGDSTDLVLVHHRESGLTAADKATAAGEMKKVAAEHALASPPRAVPSEDGTTLMYAVSGTEPGTDEVARDVFVHDIRETVSGEVGGPGALATDASEVYDSLDGPLLYTTVAVVAILLIVIYRSPFLWLVPPVVAGVADHLSMAVTHALHQGFDISVSGQSAGVMTILVFGAGTDDALLPISRYREELRRAPRPYDAMVAALRGCGPAVLASSGAVALGMLCLLAADMNSIRGMGPTTAVGTGPGPTGHHRVRVGSGGPGRTRVCWSGPPCWAHGGTSRCVTGADGRVGTAAAVPT
ncbi:MMPL family transporter, partial [Streptomyces sp. NPDC058661]|uniref:MMPL family transporter n=1 Tax=Streptomyces sp. NPDC058661 TaxID=3346582 RepID=UPI003660DACF